MSPICPSISPGLSLEDALAIGRLDAHDQASLAARGDLSQSDLVEAAVLRVEVLDPTLNALTHRDYDDARRRALTASGPMAGVPCLVKDGLDYPGMPNRAASRSRRDAGPGRVSFPYADHLTDCGLVVLGKTNASEFGLLPSTEPLLYGPARNPWAPDRSPGGSSGGSAVAVASGMVPLAHAADGGGSIRIPASCCGVLGLKPGRGANVRARAPHFIEDLLACDVLLARTVRDMAWAFAAAAPVTARCDAEPPGRRYRIALCMDNLWGDGPFPAVRQVISRTAELCATLGHEVEEARLPVDGPGVLTAFQSIWGYLAREAAASGPDDDRRTTGRHALEPWTVGLAKWSDGLEVTDAERIFHQAVQASADLQAFFQRYDCILSPVLRRPAVRIGELSPSQPVDAIMSLMYDYVSYTPLHNLSGHPAISIPLFQGEDGVPIGSMFAAAHGRECTLIDLAAELESAAPWQGRWPHISIGGDGAPGRRA